MRVLVGVPVVCSLFLGLAVPAAGQDAGELEQLRQQLEALKRQDEQRRRTIQAIESRIQALEAQRPGAAAPPQTQGPAPATEPETAQAPAVEEPPARREPPATRVVETVVAEEHGLFERRFTFEPSITYARFDRATVNLSGFLALDAIFLGNISVDEVESDIITLDIAGRYGLTDRLQVFVDAPFIYRRSNFLSGGAGGAAAVQAEQSVHDGPTPGDVSFGLSYRLLPETAKRPDIVMNLSAKAPTGTEPYGIPVVEVPGTQGNLQVPEELPTGNGVWSVAAGLSFLKTYDPAVFFANVTYFHNFEEGFDDIDDAAGDQPGDVDLGDAFQVGLGVAFALNERTSLSLSYTQRLIAESRTRFQGGSFNDVVGSDANVAVLNAGLTFAASEHLSIVTNLGAGLTSDAADVQFTLRFPYTF